MKRVICLLLVVSGVFFTTGVNAEWVKNSQSLLIQIKKQEVLKPLTAEEKLARQHPGRYVPYGKVIFVIKRNPLRSFYDFFHYKETQKQQKVVAFDPSKGQQGGFTYLDKETTRKSELKLDWDVVFCLMGLGTMVYSIYRIERYGIKDEIGSIFLKITAIITTVIAVVVAAIVTTNVAFVTTPVAIAIAAIAAMVSIISIVSIVIENDIALFRFFSAIYCIAIIVMMFV